MEVYQCSFDSNSVDMVVIPALKVCLFDSTDPHAFKPKTNGREKIIDLYDIAVTPGTDEKYRNEITVLTTKYKDFMRKGLQELKQYGEKIVREEDAKPFPKEKLHEEVKEILSEIERS
jgi:hypothetical protein